MLKGECLILRHWIVGVRGECLLTYLCWRISGGGCSTLTNLGRFIQSTRNMLEEM